MLLFVLYSVIVFSEFLLLYVCLSLSLMIFLGKYEESIVNYITLMVNLQETLCKLCLGTEIPRIINTIYIRIDIYTFVTLK